MSKSKEIADLNNKIADLTAQNAKLASKLAESSSTKVKEKAKDLSARLAALTDSDKLRDFGEAVKPYVDRGVIASKAATASARDTLVKEVVPAAASALATALDVIGDRSKQAKKAVEKAAAVVEPEPAKRSKGKGKGWIGALIGAAAFAAVAYVAYSAYTATDEHWIALDDESRESV